jgi:hypothetical protein
MALGESLKVGEISIGIYSFLLLVKCKAAITFASEWENKVAVPHLN